LDRNKIFYLKFDEVVAQYILLADNTQAGFGTSDNWTPKLYSYQQSAFNVLYFSFIDPLTMTVPKSFINLVSKS